MPSLLLAGYLKLYDTVFYFLGNKYFLVFELCAGLMDQHYCDEDLGLQQDNLDIFTWVKVPNDFFESSLDSSY